MRTSRPDTLLDREHASFVQVQWLRLPSKDGHAPIAAFVLPFGGRGFEALRFSQAGVRAHSSPAVIQRSDVHSTRLGRTMQLCRFARECALCVTTGGWPRVRYPCPRFLFVLSIIQFLVSLFAVLDLADNKSGISRWFATLQYLYCKALPSPKLRRHDMQVHGHA